jgi:hypothetical protein
VIKRVFRFWIAFGESPIFNKKDRTMFYVVPADGNREMKLERESFVEAETLDDARRLLIAEVEKWYSHHVHMADLDEVGKKRAATAAAEAKSASSTTSLTIFDL